MKKIKMFSLILGDIFTPKTMKRICIALGIMIALWLLVVPCTWIIREKYPEIPIVRSLDWNRMNTIIPSYELPEDYGELFAFSYSSVYHVLIFVYFGAVFLIGVITPWVLLLAGIIITIILLILLWVFITKIPTIISRFKKYLKAVRERVDKNMQKPKIPCKTQDEGEKL